MTLLTEQLRNNQVELPDALREAAVRCKCSESRAFFEVAEIYADRFESVTETKLREEIEEEYQSVLTSTEELIQEALDILEDDTASDSEKEEAPKILVRAIAELNK